MVTGGRETIRMDIARPVNQDITPPRGVPPSDVLVVHQEPTNQATKVTSVAVVLSGVLCQQQSQKVRTIVTNGQLVIGGQMNLEDRVMERPKSKRK